MTAPEREHWDCGGRAWMARGRRCRVRRCGCPRIYLEGLHAGNLVEPRHYRVVGMSNVGYIHRLRRIRPLVFALFSGKTHVDCPSLYGSEWGCWGTRTAIFEIVIAANSV